MTKNNVQKKEVTPAVKKEATPAVKTIEARHVFGEIYEKDGKYFRWMEIQFIDSAEGKVFSYPINGKNEWIKKSEIENLKDKYEDRV